MSRLNSLSQPVKTTVRIALSGIIIFISGTTINSCVKESPLNNNLVGQNNLNILFKVSYDEETATFANHWPDGIITGLGKSANSSEEDVFLEDYQIIQQTITFDENGYFSMTSYNIEGDESIRMPQAVYDEVKDIMPERGADHDPITGMEVSMGIINLKLKSGDLIEAGNIDPDELRVDPLILDSLLNLIITDTTGVTGRIARNINQLNRSGIQYNMIGEEFVYINNPYNNCSGGGDFSEVKRVIDLKTGNVIKEGLVRLDGKYEFVSAKHYKQVNKFWIMETEEIYTMGYVDGEWKTKYTTHKHRKNINITYNPINK